MFKYLVFCKHLFVTDAYFPKERWIEKRKYNSLVALLAMLCLIFLLLMCFRYIQEEIFLAKINFIAFFVSLILSFFLRKDKENFTWVSRFFIFITSILITIVITSSNNDSRIIWLSSMTIYTFYFRDKKEGIYWSIFLALLIIFAQYSDIIEVSSTLHTLDMIAIFINFAIVSLLLSWYENIKIHDRDNLLAQIKEKEELNKQLHEENVKRTEMEKALKILADTDPMTKLYNRRFFSTTAKHALEIARRTTDRLSIIMLDIDKFKNFNDTYGHDVGDDVIIKFAEILKECSRKSDVVCRWGGEEFIILLPKTNIQGAVILAEKIRAMVESTKIVLSDNENINFTVSAGVSESKKNSSDISEIIKNADSALYDAKNSGRNKVCKR